MARYRIWDKCKNDWADDLWFRSRAGAQDHALDIAQQSELGDWKESQAKDWKRKWEQLEIREY